MRKVALSQLEQSDRHFILNLGPYLTATVRYGALLRYIWKVSYQERAVSALEAALRTTVRARRADGPKRDVVVTVDDDTELLVRWLPVGWPRQVDEALHDHPRPDILTAPLMSPGARNAARSAGVGWADESGAADIHIRQPSGTIIVIEIKGTPRLPLDTRLGWRPAALAVCEAILSGKASPTVSSIEDTTGLSTGSVVAALKFLDQEGHLTSATARGPGAARRVVDRDALLDAYAAAAERLRPPTSIPVGVLWRDPIAGVIATGRLWDGAGIDWGATSALAASQLAPMQTEIAPMEVYVPGRTPSDLRRAAHAAGLQEMTGGRLILRPFPTPAKAKLTEQTVEGFRSMSWPRVYADLRTTGVRGEDAAEHLREEMTTK